MKKVALLFSLILIAQSAQAFIDNQYMKTEQFLVNTGYSAEAAKITAINSENPYREPHVEKKNFKNIMRRVYHYIVPGQGGDLDFYNHSIDSNGWGWKDY